MNIQLTVEELHPLLESVKGVVENNQLLPILTHVLVQIKNNQLTLTTTDMEIEIKASKKVNPTEDISFTINTKDLINITTKLPEKTIIKFTIEKSKIYIKINNNLFELNTLDYQNFPSLTKTKADDIIKINYKVLKELIDKTSFSMGNQDIRAYLNGLYLEADKDNITVVATDGHRLSIGKIEQKNKLSSKKTLIIPRKTIIELTKILNNDKNNHNNNDEIEIHTSDNYFYLKDNNITLVSRLISGNFPNYTQVIPTDFDNNVIINREEFLDNLKQASIFVEHKKGVKLLFKKNNLSIFSHSEKGQAKTQVKTKNFDKEMEIGFNHSYLISILEKLTATTINMIISDKENQSCLLNSDQAKDKPYQYIVMPMKI